MGYGTQFAPELEEGNNIVDSPIEGQKRDTKTLTQENQITDAQRRAIYAIYNALGYSETQMKEIMQTRYNKSDSKLLTKQEASDFIDYLNNIKDKKLTH